jgi:hypothetical protein
MQCNQHAEFWNVKLSGTYSNWQALKVWQKYLNTIPAATVYQKAAVSENCRI